MFHITQPLGIWSIMATIRWCPIFPIGTFTNPCISQLVAIKPLHHTQNPNSTVEFSKYGTLHPMVGSIPKCIHVINVDKTIRTALHHPPVITIFIGGMVTIPSHGWFMALPTLWDSLDIAAIAIPNTVHDSFTHVTHYRGPTKIAPPGKSDLFTMKSSLRQLLLAQLHAMRGFLWRCEASKRSVSDALRSV